MGRKNWYGGDIQIRQGVSPDECTDTARWSSKWVFSNFDLSFCAEHRNQEDMGLEQRKSLNFVHNRRIIIGERGGDEERETWWRVVQEETKLVF